MGGTDVGDLFPGGQKEGDEMTLPLDSTVPSRPWKILVVDDEKEVHSVTKLVLDDLQFSGRDTSLLHAYSAKEARQLLTEHQDIAVALIDVVMEDDEAGLKLVKYIREDLQNLFCRIIIRTGQPGCAPEDKIVFDYDIDAYREKVELTSNKFITTVITSLRAYHDLVKLDRYSSTLERTNEELVQTQSKLHRANEHLADKVAELEVARQALSQSESRLSATLNSVGEAVIATNLDGRITLMNRIAQELTGWSFDEARGQPCKQVLALFDEESSAALDPADLVNQSDPTGQAVARLRTKDDQTRVISCNQSPISGSTEQNFGQVFVFRDITEQRRLEARVRQQQKLESLGTLASGMAHEISNPLTGIVSYAELTKRRIDSGSEAVPLINEIIFETERVAKIVKKLLAFARKEPTVDPVQPAKMSEIIDSVLFLIRSAIIKDQIELEVDVPPTLPQILCVGQQIQQVIMNLVINARDALNQRYPGIHPSKVIQIRSSLISKQGAPLVRTVVEDRGTGIDATIIDRLFDPFFTTKSPGNGTGLGLAVSHGIVKAHDGDLWIESKMGDFTRVYLDLKACE